MYIVNITKFINRKSYIYSIGDIALPQPIALSTFVVGFVFLLIYTFPLFMIFGLHGVLSAFLYLGPPILAAVYATRPVFGEKTFFEMFSSLRTFWGEPKGWYDLKATDYRDTIYNPYHEILVSRKRELQILADIIEGRSVVDSRFIRSTPITRKRK